MTDAALFTRYATRGLIESEQAGGLGTMTLRTVRTLIAVTLAAVALAIELPNLYLFVHPMYGDFDFIVYGGVVRSVGPAAQRSGIQPGDRVEFSKMPAEDRFSAAGRLPPVGRKVTFQLTRSGVPFAATLTAIPDRGESAYALWAMIAKKAATLTASLLGTAVFLIRPTLLSGAIFVVAIGWALALPFFYSFLPPTPYFWLETISNLIRASATGAFVVVSLLLGRERSSAYQRRLPLLVLLAALPVAHAAANALAAWNGTPTPAGVAVVAEKLYVLAGVFLLIVTALRASTSGGERFAAVALASAGVSRMLAGPWLLMLPGQLQEAAAFVHYGSSAITVSAVLIVAYAIIRERVIDTGLIASRVMSYGALSTLVVVAPGLAHWAFATNLPKYPWLIPLEVALAVVLGYRWSGLRDVADALSLAAVDAQIAAEHGRAGEERDALVRALGLAQRTHQRGLIAEIRARCAFSAWVNGDDEAFARHVAALREAMGPRSLRGLAAFARAASSEDVREPSDALDVPEWTARASLIACGRVADTLVARACAREALAAARSDGSPWLRILALVALSEFLPAQRAELLDDAIAIASAAGWLTLRKSLLAIRADARDLGMLRPFVELRLRKIRPQLPAIKISFMSGEVRIMGERIDFHEKERALLFAVARTKAPISNVELVDSLWPETDGDAAQNAFRACLFRLRKRAADQRIIRRVGRAYALCSGAEVDLWRLEDALAAGVAGLSADTLVQLDELYAAFCAGRQERALLGAWFEPFERMLERKMTQTEQMLLSAQVGSARA